MVKRIFRFLYYRIKWRKSLKTHLTSYIGNNSSFEGMNQIHPHASFSGDMGYGSYIGPYSILSGSIGRFSSIAPNVTSNNGLHPYTYPYASTSPCFFSLNPNHSQNGGTFAVEQKFEEFKYADEKKKYPIIIGSDCWIGQNVFIVGGVKIGDGAVVLAGAVVTKDIPPYAIVGGIPATVLKYRYSQADINFLLKIKWWNNSPKWFEKHWPLLNDITKLRMYYERDASKTDI